MESIGKQFDKALAHYELKEYGAAERAVDGLLATHPDFHRAQFLKAVILEETGRSADAAAHYERAGNRITLWSRLAVQLQERDAQRALVYYERVAKLDPQNNAVWFNMGTLYEQLDRSDEARACFRHLAPLREILSRIVIPLGFMILLASGAAMMIRRGERGLTAAVIASSVFCLFWLKRDALKAVQMLMKKRRYR